ncbi:sigma-70 family RNA polymerase sigma factor [Candidatus Saccharibacteria bacterium]|nr:sigma-70 family RNA polymerase sigma factor [Candidatus Saccharibacteria bacterium]MCB0094105.1 sigma-70 family RNA polymerase sigma factor [Caldilineaceae bacterium]MCB0139428.1 sigma-70 family RNA polymerase sigma factor [Caldilineaceae bacterium]
MVLNTLSVTAAVTISKARGTLMEEIEQLIQKCQCERESYHESKGLKKESPDCLELIRLALEGNTEAFGAMYNIFAPEFRNRFRQKSIEIAIEIDELLQIIFLKLLRLDVSSLNFVEGEELGPFIKYLDTIARNTINDIWRKEKSSNLYKPDQEQSGDDLDKFVTIRAIHRRIQELLKDDQEHLVFHLRFGEDWKPSEIYQEHQNEFSDIKEVYRILEKILRRMRQDPLLKSLWNQEE